LLNLLKIIRAGRAPRLPAASDHRRNASDVGCRASLGMSVKEVDTLYGEPLRVFTTKTGRIARIYGNHQELENVDHFLLFSYVAVLFDTEGHALGVFSDGFFDDHWDPVLLQQSE
jgi:hypothetical protein